MLLENGEFSIKIVILTALFGHFVIEHNACSWSIRRAWRQGLDITVITSEMPRGKDNSVAVIDYKNKQADDARTNI